jgi:hypothetical protein
MNEKTKLLAGKALDTAVSYTWTTLDYEQIHELLACHAKLIVRECVQLCQECIDDGCVEAQEPMEKIKEHFGVEE